MYKCPKCVLHERVTARTHTTATSLGPGCTVISCLSFNLLVRVSVTHTLTLIFIYRKLHQHHNTEQHYHISRSPAVCSGGFLLIDKSQNRTTLRPKKMFFENFCIQVKKEHFNYQFQILTFMQLHKK